MLFPEVMSCEFSFVLISILLIVIIYFSQLFAPWYHIFCGNRRGLFLFWKSLLKQREAVVYEHFFGRTITNTTHAESFVILFKTFDYFQHAKRKMSHSLYIYVSWKLTIDKTQFASLVFLVLYADQLHPDKPLAEVVASKKKKGGIRVINLFMMIPA